MYIYIHICDKLQKPALMQSKSDDLTGMACGSFSGKMCELDQVSIRFPSFPSFPSSPIHDATCLPLQPHL